MLPISVSADRFASTDAYLLLPLGASTDSLHGIIRHHLAYQRVQIDAGLNTGKLHRVMRVRPHLCKEIKLIRRGHRSMLVREQRCASDVGQEHDCSNEQRDYAANDALARGQQRAYTALTLAPHPL